MTASYILLRCEVEEEADALLGELAAYPNLPLRAPLSGKNVHVGLVGGVSAEDIPDNCTKGSALAAAVMWSWCHARELAAEVVRPGRMRGLRSPYSGPSASAPANTKFDIAWRVHWVDEEEWT